MISTVDLMFYLQLQISREQYDRFFSSVDVFSGRMFPGALCVCVFAACVMQIFVRLLSGFCRWRFGVLSLLAASLNFCTCRRKVLKNKRCGGRGKLHPWWLQQSALSPTFAIRWFIAFPPAAAFSAAPGKTPRKCATPFRVSHYKSKATTNGRCCCCVALGFCRMATVFNH